MPVVIIAEIGINHNADLGIAKRLIEVCATAGVDYVKFQKRDPDICVPDDQKGIMRDTPWGRMTYLDYRRKMEFGKHEYDVIDLHCLSRGIKWTASAWDIPSLDFIKRYGTDFVKIPSAMLTDKAILEAVKYPVILSTGMSNMAMVKNAVEWTGEENVKGILHCISTYPAKTEELNLSCIPVLKREFQWANIGYSNHHPGIIFLPIAVALGAKIIEFHVTLDRSMWGTDQAASIEPEGVMRAVKYIRNAELSVGDGDKRIYDSEIPIMKKLRKS